MVFVKGADGILSCRIFILFSICSLNPIPRFEIRTSITMLNHVYRPKNISSLNRIPALLLKSLSRGKRYWGATSKKNHSRQKLWR